MSAVGNVAQAPTLPRLTWRLWWQQLAAVMLKEAKQVIRDPSSWIIAVALPLMFLFLFGYGLSLDTTTVKIALVREDSSQDARALTSSIEHSKWFVVQHAATRAEGKQLLQDQAVKATIIVPAEFGARLRSQGQMAQIQVLIDGTEPNTANYVRGYVNAIWSGFLSGRRMNEGLDLEPPITIEPRY